MAKITRNTSTHRQFGSAPYGNLSVLAYRIQTNASGAVINSDSTAAVAIGDVIDLGTIPAGKRLDDFVASTLHRHVGVRYRQAELCLRRRRGFGRCSPGRREFPLTSYSSFGPCVRESAATSTARKSMEESVTIRVFPILPRKSSPSMHVPNNLRSSHEGKA